MENSEADLELKHLYLVLTDEQWERLLDFYPAEIRDIERDKVHLIAYWRGEKYGVVHATTNDENKGFVS